MNHISMNSKPIGHRGIGVSPRFRSYTLIVGDIVSGVAIVATDKPKIGTEARPPIKDRLFSFIVA